MSLSSFLCTQLNGFKYFYLSRIILFIINHLFAHRFQVLLWNSNNFSSVIFCTHWNGYTYDLLVNSLLVISFLIELKLISLYPSIAMISTQLNGFNYCYLILIIQFNTNHLFADREMVTSIAI